MADIDNTDNIPKGLFSLWLGFTLSITIFIIPIFLSIYLGVFYFPIIALALSGITYAFLRYRREKNKDKVDCLLPLYIMARVMLAYGIIMLIVNVFVLRLSELKIDLMEVDKSFHFYYFPVLILSVLLAISCYISNKTVCIYCVNCNGYSTGNNMFNKLQKTEITNAMRQLILIGIVLAVAGWGYFFFLYNSANISNFDRLIFSGVPIIIVLIHEIAISIRYLSLAIYSEDLYTDTPYKKNNTLIRYIVVSGNKMLLYKNAKGEYDTPFSLNRDFITSITAHEAEQLFKRKYQIGGIEMKTIYTNVDNFYKSSIIHEFAFVDDEESAPKIKDGEWCDIQKIEKISKDEPASPLLKSEMYRIFMTLLAYKQFDISGNRRYKIKGYTPSVQVSDVKNCNVDYNDKRWLLLLSINRQNNSLLFRCRKFFYKYVEGVID